MTFADWLTTSRAAVQENGIHGLRTALDELYWGVRARLRALHWLTPDTRVVAAGGVQVSIRQETRAEWDALRAIHNEDWLTRRLVDDIQPDDVVWDVGGNIGVYSLLAAAAGAEVVTFEPWLENAAAIERNTRRNHLEDRVQVVPKALSDTAGTSEFVLDERAAAGGGRGSLHLDWQDGATRRVETVRARDIVASDGLNIPIPDVVKVDVEGAEAEVLAGFGDMLASPRVVYVELHGVTDDATRRRLNDYDYTVTHDLEDSGCGVIRAEREASQP